MIVIITIIIAIVMITAITSFDENFQAGALVVDRP